MVARVVIEGCGCCCCAGRGGREGTGVSGTRLNASSISACVKPFCSRKDILEALGLPRTCAKDGTAVDDGFF